MEAIKVVAECSVAAGLILLFIAGAANLLARRIERIGKDGL